MLFYNFVFQSENVRWTQSIKTFEAQEITVCGDVLLTAAFVSYIGSFTKPYRQELMEHMWLPFLKSQEVSVCNAKLGMELLCLDSVSAWCCCFYENAVQLFSN